MAAHILNDFIVVNCTTSEVDSKNECIHFLTHIGRHQKCLSNVISSHIKKVYTSEFNVWYLKTFFNVNSSQFVSVPLWTKRKVQSKGQTFTFEFLNANHCPGAVMVLIKGSFGTYLYTGNCRYSPAMLDYSSLKPYLQGVKVLDKLYVNAAYLKVGFNFPKRDVVVQQVLDFISEHSEERIYMCCRLLGKEDILFRIALELNERMYITPEKLKIMNKLGFKCNSFTTDISLARLRVVDVGEVTWIKMKRRRLTEKCVGIIFSACNNNAEKQEKNGIYVFPASDHNSAAETKLMIRALPAKDIYLLNNDSTLSREIISQKNILQTNTNENISLTHSNSPLILNEKHNGKNNGKKRLSLRLNSVRDENKPPSQYYENSANSPKQHPPVHNVLNEQKCINNSVSGKPKEDPRSIHRNLSVSRRGKVSKASSNISGSKPHPKPTEHFEKSFLIDENTRTGFSSSGEHTTYVGQKNGLSPSFPPSVSNIILDSFNSSSESFKENGENRLNGSPENDQISTNKPVMPDEEAPDGAPPSDTEVGSHSEQYLSSSIVLSSCLYHTLSPSYPVSSSNIVSSRMSDKIQATSRNSTKEVPCTCISGVNSTELSNKISQTNCTRKKPFETCGNKSSRNSVFRKRTRSKKTDRSSYTANLKEIVEVNETVSDSGEVNENRADPLFQQVVISESKSTINDTEAMIQTKLVAQDQSSCQHELVSMVETRLASQNDDTQSFNSTVDPLTPECPIVPLSHNQLNKLPPSELQVKLHEKESGKNVIIQTSSSKEMLTEHYDCNTFKPSNSSPLSDLLMGKISSAKSIFVIDDLNFSKMELCTTIPFIGPSTGLSVPIISSKNHSECLKLDKGLTSMINGETSLKNTSLFTADIIDNSNEKGKNIKDSNTLLVNDNTAKLSNVLTEKELLTSLVSSSMNEKGFQPEEKANGISDHSTVLVINHNVTCQIHYNSPSKVANVQQNVYDQSTLIPDDHCHSNSEVAKKSNPTNLVDSQITENPVRKDHSNMMSTSGSSKNSPVSSSNGSNLFKPSPNPEHSSERSPYGLRRGSNKLSTSQRSRASARRKTMALPLVLSSVKKYSKTVNKSTSLTQPSKSESSMSKSTFSKSQTVSNFGSTDRSKSLFEADSIGNFHSKEAPTDLATNGESHANAGYVAESIHSMTSVQNKIHPLPINKKSSADIFSSDASISGSVSAQHLDSSINKNKISQIGSKKESFVKDGDKAVIIKPPLTLSQPNLGASYSFDKLLSSSLSYSQPPISSSSKKMLRKYFATSLSSGLNRSFR